MYGMKSLWTPLAVSVMLCCVFMLQGKLKNALRLGCGWIIHGERVKALIFSFSVPGCAALWSDGVSWGKKSRDHPYIDTTQIGRGRAGRGNIQMGIASCHFLKNYFNCFIFLNDFDSYLNLYLCIYCISYYAGSHVHIIIQCSVELLLMSAGCKMRKSRNYVIIAVMGTKCSRTGSELQKFVMWMSKFNHHRE